jgi:hypothetical protein
MFATHIRRRHAELKICEGRARTHCFYFPRRQPLDHHCCPLMVDLAAAGAKRYKLIYVLSNYKRRYGNFSTSHEKTNYN